MALPREITDLLRAETAPSARSRALDYLSSLTPADRADLENHLRREGVFPLVSEALGAGGLGQSKQETFRAAALHLARRAALARASHALEEAALDYVVFKGAHLTPLLYSNPTLRPALDVDVLVRARHQEQAIDALTNVGFELHHRAETASHELNLTDGAAWIDLHWHLLRPGRMRAPVEEEIISTRERAGGERESYWVPSTTWTTVIMLVHNAVTDTVNGRAIRAVDLQRWITRAGRSIDWDDVANKVDRMGLRAAAWATLYWTDSLLGLALDESVWRAFAPPRLQQAYLRAWMAADPAKLYQRHPQLVRAGFGLAMHDTPRDAVRFIGSFLQTVRERRR